MVSISEYKGGQLHGYTVAMSDQFLSQKLLQFYSKDDLIFQTEIVDNEEETVEGEGSID